MRNIKVESATRIGVRADGRAALTAIFALPPITRLAPHRLLPPAKLTLADSRMFPAPVELVKVACVTAACAIRYEALWIWSFPAGGADRLRRSYLLECCLGIIRPRSPQGIRTTVEPLVGE